MSTLLPGDLATRGKPYDILASIWTAFVSIKHNTSPAIDSDAFASIPQTPSYRAPFHGVISAIAVSALQRHRPGRPASYDVSTVSFSADYGFWPSDDKDAQSYALRRIILSTPTCLCGHSCLQSEHAAKPVYNIVTAAVMTARRNTASDGALPERIFSPQPGFQYTRP